MKRLTRILLITMVFIVIGTASGCGKETEAPNEPAKSDNKVTESAAAVEKVNTTKEGIAASSSNIEKKSQLSSPSAVTNQLKKSQPSGHKTGWLLISKNYGKESILEKKLLFKNGDTVMSILMQNAAVDTDYDGGFVEGINGIKNVSGGISGQNQDWFYFVNGVLTDVGASDLTLGAKDTVWWDYHAWTKGSFSPSVIGCYPEPFLHGFRGNSGVTIFYTKEGKASAQSLLASLKKMGVTKTAIEAISDQALGRKANPGIIMGTWKELNTLKSVKDLNEAFNKTGAFSHFTDKELELFNNQGKPAKKVSKDAAIIISTAQGMGDSSPVWLIVGIDSKSLQSAADILINNPQKIYRMYGAAVINGKVVSLPLQN